MPAPSLPVVKKIARKIRPPSKQRVAQRTRPSFAEGMRPFIGMIKNAPSNLSMREGFGD